MSPSKTVPETGTSTHTTASLGLPCFAISFVTATVFTTLTGMSGDSIAGVTFPAGLTIFGQFSEVTLASGSVVIYCR